jgi:hypothetical protein
MSPSPEPESKGWWQTLPGILTADAGIITAVTGLLLALHQLGVFNRAPQPAAQIQNPPSSTSAGSASYSTSTAAGSRPLRLPATTQVRSGENVYQLLSAQIAPYAPGKVALRLNIRMTNNGNYPVNFWAVSFRVLVDGSLLAPNSDLDDVVASHATGEAALEFVLPESVSTVGLQIGDVGEGKPTIPIALH